jgi:NADPH oxidase
VQFTISSAPEDPFISVHIRQIGDFTRALGQRLGAAQSAAELHIKEKLDFDEVDLDDLDEKGSMKQIGRRGEWIEVSPSMGLDMPVLRVDG